MPIALTEDRPVDCVPGSARPARTAVIAAVILGTVGFFVTLFSAISACPVNLAGGLLMVGASRPLAHAVHIHSGYQLPFRLRFHHQLRWSAMAAVMLAAGTFLSAQSA